MTDSTIIEEDLNGMLVITHTGSEYQLTHFKVFEDFVFRYNENLREISILKKALCLAVGELSTHGSYSIWSPDQLLEQFMEEARRG